MKVAGSVLSSFFTEKFLRSFVPRKFAARVVAVTIAGPIVVSITTGSRADEGGVSFWVPGFFGSLAATPQVPGFSFGNIFYYSQVSAGGNVAFAKLPVRHERWDY